MRLERSQALGKPTTVVLLKGCSNKMTPNNVLLFPTDWFIAQLTSQKLLLAVDSG